MLAENSTPAPRKEEEEEAYGNMAFRVFLMSPNAKKILVIKEVEAITGLGLKDAKGLVDLAPSVIKEGIPKGKAEEIKDKLEASGATVELQKKYRLY